ncbi:hypothetical protein CYMTET_36680, partial [Cymbomonas tetramitiformis]
MHREQDTHGCPGWNPNRQRTRAMTITLAPVRPANVRSPRQLEYQVVEYDFARDLLLTDLDGRHLCREPQGKRSWRLKLRIPTNVAQSPGELWKLEPYNNMRDRVHRVGFRSVRSGRYVKAEKTTGCLSANTEDLRGWEAFRVLRTNAPRGTPGPCYIIQSSHGKFWSVIDSAAGMLMANVECRTHATVFQFRRRRPCAQPAAGSAAGSTGHLKENAHGAHHPAGENGVLLSILSGRRYTGIHKDAGSKDIDRQPRIIGKGSSPGAKRRRPHLGPAPRFAIRCGKQPQLEGDRRVDDRASSETHPRTAHAHPFSVTAASKGPASSERAGAPSKRGEVEAEPRRWMKKRPHDQLDGRAASPPPGAAETQTHLELAEPEECLCEGNGGGAVQDEYDPAVDPGGNAQPIVEEDEGTPEGLGMEGDGGAGVNAGMCANCRCEAERVSAEPAAAERQIHLELERYNDGQRARKQVTLSSLIQEGLLIPGENVLSLQHGSHRYLASVRADGMIVSTAGSFKSPSAWALSVRQSENPLRRGDDGWLSLTYGGQPLQVLRERLIDRQPHIFERLSAEQRPGGGKRKRSDVTDAASDPPAARLHTYNIADARNPNVGGADGATAAAEGRASHAPAASTPVTRNSGDTHVQLDPVMTNAPHRGNGPSQLAARGSPSSVHLHRSLSTRIASGGGDPPASQATTIRAMLDACPPQRLNHLHLSSRYDPSLVQQVLREELDGHEVADHREILDLIDQVQRERGAAFGPPPVDSKQRSLHDHASFLALKHAMQSSLGHTTRSSNREHGQLSMTVALSGLRSRQAVTIHGPREWLEELQRACRQSYDDMFREVQPIGMPSVGRHANALLNLSAEHALGATSKVPVVVFVQPDEHALYREHWPNSMLAILPHAGRGPGYARHVMMQVFDALGAAAYWEMDDNIAYFMRTPADISRRELATFKDALLDAQRHVAEIRDVAFAGFDAYRGSLRARLKNPELVEANRLTIYKVKLVNLGCLRQDAGLRGVQYEFKDRVLEDILFNHRILRQGGRSLKVYGYSYRACHWKMGGCSESRVGKLSSRLAHTTGALEKNASTGNDSVKDAAVASSDGEEEADAAALSDEEVEADVAASPDEEVEADAAASSDGEDEADAAASSDEEIIRRLSAKFRGRASARVY